MKSFYSFINFLSLILANFDKYESNEMSLPKIMSSNVVSKPNSVGIGPVSLLLLSSISFNPVDPRSVGMLPIRSLSSSASSSNKVNDPNWDGISPVSSFPPTITITKYDDQIRHQLL